MKKLMTSLMSFLIIFAIGSTCFASSKVQAKEIEPRQVKEETSNEVSAITTTSEDVDATVTSEDTDTTVTSEDTGLEESASILNSDLYECASISNPKDLVDGNAYICAETATINTAINGNLFVVAKNVEVTSNAKIYGDLFVCAENITINGGYMVDMYAVSQTLSISSDAFIARDVKACSQTASLKGTIGRDFDLSVKTLTVDFQTASVGNNFNYMSSIEVPELDKIVDGEVNFNKIEVQEEDSSAVIATLVSGLVIFSIIKAVFDLICLLILAIVLLCGTKKFTNTAARNLKAHPFLTLVYGLLGTLFTAIIGILLMITIIGAPLGLLCLSILLIFIAVSKTIAIVILSKMISNNLGKKNGVAFLFVLLFAIVFTIVEFIPFIGSFIALMLNLYGLGVIFYAMFGKKDELKTEPTFAESVEVKEVETKKDEAKKAESKKVETKKDDKKDSKK